MKTNKNNFLDQIDKRKKEKQKRKEQGIVNPRFIENVKRYCTENHVFKHNDTFLVHYEPLFENYIDYVSEK